VPSARRYPERTPLREPRPDRHRTDARADRRPLARRTSASPPPSVTAAGMPSVPDGAAIVSIPASRWVAETFIDEVCQQPRFAGV